MTDHIAISPKDALVSALINGLINGGVAWMVFKGQALVPMSLDIISTQEKSVWGQAVGLTFGLGLILSVISAKVFAAHVAKTHPALAAKVNRPIFPDLIKIAISNVITLFGWFVALAILWTKAFGVVSLPTAAAAAAVGVFAAVITVFVEVWTKSALLR